MLSRALSLATVTLLIGGCAAVPAWGQATNLEAGKSPSQIFAGTCTACHKSPRGLLKSVPAGSLQSFLRQHYTTSPDMASSLTGFLVSNGAADTRAQPKEGKEGKTEARTSAPSEQLDRFGRRLRPASQEAARPETEPREAARPDAEGPHGRNAKRLARPGEAPAAEGRTPAEAAGEIGPEGSKLPARQKFGKRGKPGEEQPKTESPKTESAKSETGKEEPAKGEAAREEQPKSESAKVENGKPEDAKPPGEGKSESAKIEVPKEPGSGEPATLRADPVPPVTPAPAASPTVSAAVHGVTPEPAAGQSALPAAQPAAPPTVTAAAPPPVEPAGPPAPPISQ